METSFKSTVELKRYYNTEERCKALLAQQRWNGNVVCPHCGHGKVYVTNRGYKCASKECYKKFSVISGTIFENTKIKLTLWFEAIAVLSAHKKGISSHQLGRDLGVSQKTAWFILHRVREMLKEKNPTLLSGTNAIDETFIGGSLKNKHKAVRYEKVERRGRAFKNKSMVAGILNENGTVVNKVIPNTSVQVLKTFMVENVVLGSTMVSDAWQSYIYATKGYTHVVVDHTKDEYVKNGFTTNGLEGYWSQLKRGIYGIYHQVSPTHLGRYCDEFAFRYNTRKQKDTERFFSILKATSGRLSWNQLTGK